MPLNQNQQTNKQINRNKETSKKIEKKGNEEKIPGLKRDLSKQ